MRHFASDGSEMDVVDTAGLPNAPNRVNHVDPHFSDRSLAEGEPISGAVDYFEKLQNLLVIGEHSNS